MCYSMLLIILRNKADYEARVYHSLIHPSIHPVRPPDTAKDNIKAEKIKNHRQSWKVITELQYLFLSSSFLVSHLHFLNKHVV